MAPKKAKSTVAPAGQPTIGAAFARKSGEGVAAAAGLASPDAAPAAPPLVLVRQLGGVVEYSDFAVNNIKDEAGAKPSANAPEADIVDSEARFVEAMSDMLHAHPEQAPPQSLVERLLALLMRPRTPAAPAVTAAAFQALMKLHELHPPTTVEDLPPSAAIPLRLVENPRAWAPVDAAQRARRSGGAAADPAASKRGFEFDKAAFAGVIAAAAAGGGALGAGELTPEAAALCGGARLALMHTATVLSDDAAARLRVYAAATSAGAGSAQRKDALFNLVHTAHLWRLFYMMTGLERGRIIDNLVALLAAGAAPHPTGRAEDAAAAAEAEREAAAAAGEDVDALDAAAAEAAQADAEMAEEEDEEEAASPRAATQEASQGDGATPGARPKRKGAAGGGGVGFTPPPSAKKQSRRLMAEAEAEEARARQLAAADGFPTPADTAAAAARIIGALMSLASAAEACAGGGDGGATIRPGKATSATTAMGASNRVELDSLLVSSAASAWKAARALARGAGGGAGGGPLAALLCAASSPLDAVRLACQAVARAARVVDAEARALVELGANGGPAFLDYVATHASDVVRGQRSSGGCPNTAAAADQAVFMVAHVVQACVAEAAPAAERRAVAEQARKAAAALQAEAGPTGLGAEAAGALDVANAALTVWLAASAV